MKILQTKYFVFFFFSDFDQNSSHNYFWVFLKKNVNFSILPQYIMFYQNCSKIRFYLLKSHFVTFFLQKTRQYPYFFFDFDKNPYMIISGVFERKKTLTFRIYPSTSCFIRIVEKVDFTTRNPMLFHFFYKKSGQYQKGVCSKGDSWPKFGGGCVHNNNSTVPKVPGGECFV